MFFFHLLTFLIVESYPASSLQGSVTPHKNRNSIASNTHRQPLAGKRLCKRMQSQARLNYAECSQPKRLRLKGSVADTKTLAETERSQLHPLPLW